MTAHDPIGVGVIGTGGFCNRFWSEAQASPEVRIVSCWDPNPENSERFSDTFGCRRSAGLDSLVRDPEVQAVAIFSPNSHHRVPAEAAAHAGKHVYVEKPIANTVEDAAAMIGACERNGVILMVGHSLRYRGVSRAVRALLDQGALGEIAMAEINLSYGNGRWLTESDWRWHRAESPGGPLMLLSVHSFDTLHYLFGLSRRVTALSNCSLLPSEIEDVFLALIEFESGVLAYAGTNYVAPWTDFVHVYGMDGIARAEADKVTYSKLEGKWELKPVDVPCPELPMYISEMGEFARAIREGTRPETSGKEGLMALAVVIACLESAEHGRTVAISEVLGDAAALIR